MEINVVENKSKFANFFFYKFYSSLLRKLREFRLMEVSSEILVWMMWIKELFRMQYSWRSAKWPVWLLHEHYIRWTFIFKLCDFTDDLYNPTYIHFVNKKGIVDGIFPMPTIRNVQFELFRADYLECGKVFSYFPLLEEGVYYIRQ